MTSPLSEEKPQRWDDLLTRARSRNPNTVAGDPFGWCEVITALADALEEERDNLDAGREIARANHDELVAANQEIERLRRRRRSVSVDLSPDLLDRLRKAIELDYLGETTASTMRVLGAEVTARVSEAQTYVQEPEVVGMVTDVTLHEAVSTEEHVVLRVEAHAGDYDHLIGEEVGIWFASLAENVAEQTPELREENTRLACRVQDAWKRAEEVEQELDAMTAVAKRFVHDDHVMDDNRWYNDGEPVTEAEFRAMDSLEEKSEGVAR